MELLKPFFYLWQWLRSDKLKVTMEQCLQNLVLWQIVFISLIGTSIFTLCFLSVTGYINLCVFGIGCAFFIGLLIVFCWSLTFVYELQRRARLLGLSGLWIYRVLCAALFFAICYSPLLPPPRFLA